MSAHGGADHYPRGERGARDAWRVAGVPDMSVPDAMVAAWLLETTNTLAARPASWAATAYLVNARDELIRELAARKWKPRRIARAARLPRALVAAAIGRLTWRDLF